jgi:hypothetical protein
MASSPCGAACDPLAAASASATSARMRLQSAWRKAAGVGLNPAAQPLMRRADTLFIASASPQARGHAGAHGVDVSHRGGRPGFVHVDIDAPRGRSVVSVPDYRGNFMFNTLGNIAAHPHAGLLFIDCDSGDLPQLAGRVDSSELGA